MVKNIRNTRQFGAIALTCAKAPAVLLTRALHHQWKCQQWKKQILSLIIMKNVWPEKLLNGLRHLCGSAHHTLKTFNLISGAFWSSLLSLPSLDGRSLKLHHVGSLNDLRFWKKFPLCYCLRHSNKNHIFYICNELEYTLKNI